MSRMRDEHPVRTGKLLIWYALGIRLAHARMSAHEHSFHGPLISTHQTTANANYDSIKQPS
jgi:hypothetical protein